MNTVQEIINNYWFTTSRSYIERTIITNHFNEVNKQKLIDLYNKNNINNGHNTYIEVVKLNNEYNESIKHIDQQKVYDDKIQKRNSFFKTGGVITIFNIFIGLELMGLATIGNYYTENYFELFYHIGYFVTCFGGIAVCGIWLFLSLILHVDIYHIIK